MSRRSATQPQFSVALGAAAVLCGLFAVLLTSDLPSRAREVVSAIGFVLGGAGIVLGGSRAMRHSSGRRRRGWQLVTSAAAIAVVGNIWSVALDVDPVRHPSLVSEGFLAVALVLAVFGLLGLSEAEHREAERLVMILDGVVVGCATLIVTSILVWQEVITADGPSEVRKTLSVFFPLLDVALATIALLLIVRSRGSRAFWCLVGGGFILYAVADLAFAVEATRGTFTFGTPHDLGWIVGYAMLAVATHHPDAVRTPDPRLAASFDVQGTVMVFGILLGALVVQLGQPLELKATWPQFVLWIILVLAAAMRQVLLTADNAALRQGLEQRVEEQTADLRRMARQTEVLLSSVGDGIYGVDVQGRVTFLNPSGAAALGQPPEALLGEVAHDRFHAPRKDGRPYDEEGCYITEAIREGLVATSEEDVYLRADGATFPVEITASPLRQEDRVTGAVVVFRDVTQRREVDRLKNEFLSVVSHELRTPLTSIRGSLGLLAGGGLGDLSPQASRMVSIAMDSSDRLTRMINDILDIERIQSGRLPMSMVPQDAAELLRTTASEMDGYARASGVRLELGRGEGTVLADGDRIVQTLTNLVGNAVKFSPSGAVVRLDALAGESEVTFAVRDDGRGIPADKLEAVFEPFEQVDSSDARLAGGTGLGLAISRGIVERHGGRIWAESVEAQGTTIRFSLPRVTTALGVGTSAAPDCPSVVVHAEDPHTVVRLSSMLTAGGFHPVGVTDGDHAVDQLVREVSTAVRGRRRDASVLLVQRGDRLARTLRPRLESQGLRVEHVRAAADGAGLVRRRRPRVVLLDLTLAEPGLLGLLRAEDVAVVLTTVGMTPEELEERMTALNDSPHGREDTQ